MKILLVDDTNSNISLLRVYIEDYCDENEIDIDKIDIDEAYNGQEAIDKIEASHYDIVFLDIMMPIMDGLEALQIIRNTDLDKQPIIIMQTALDKGKTKASAQQFGANAYITKPFNLKMVSAMLDRYLDKANFIDSDNIEDDFMDFDDFDDFDDFASDEMDSQKDMMDRFNASHKQVPASIFLEDYQNLEYILEDIEDIDSLINQFMDFLDADSLEENIQEIDIVLDKYSRFLNTFIDFYELSTSLVMLKKILDQADYSDMNQKDKEFISLYIKAILRDLLDWKNHVFVAQDAIDVFYINASSLNSCIQLESYIKKINKEG